MINVSGKDSHGDELMIRAALACLFLGGCVSVAKPPPPAQIVCPVSAMAECDTSDPATPATAAEMSADFSLDLATYFRTQRDECAALNRAKAMCLRPVKEKPR
jgi:hypothetical protein